MEQRIIASIVAWILFLLLMLVIAAYLALIIIAFVWGMKIIARNAKEPKKRPVKNFDLKDLFKKNLLVNDLLGILVVFIPFVIISVMPDEWILFDYVPFITLLIPYGLGFFRSAGIGIHCGVIGTIAGLIWLRGLPTIPPDLGDVFYFLTIIITANLSGWLGGFAGTGQIKDSKALIVFELQGGTNGLALDMLIQMVESTIEQFLPKESGKKVTTPVVTLAHTVPGNEASCTILKYERLCQWRHAYRPILLLIKNIASSNHYNMNTILDYVSNLFRYMVVEFALQSNQQKNEVCDSFYMGIMVYLETPGIAWIDKTMEEKAEIIYKKLQNKLRAVTELDQDANVWNLISDGYFIMHYWQKPTRIEQYVKNTPGSQDSQVIVKQSLFAHQITCSKEVLQRFSEIPTFFDQVRGTAYSFLLFLLFQVGLGVAINLLSELL